MNSTLTSLKTIKRLLDIRQIGGAVGVVKILIEDLEKETKLELYTPMMGCICPPTSEQTCKGLSCPRREIKL